MSHCDTHEGCPNKAYEKLSGDTGHAVLSFAAAMLKARELLNKALPQHPTEYTVCSLLHECATLLNAAGTALAVVIRAASTGNDKSEGFVTSANQLHQDANAISTKVLKWLQVYINAEKLACVKDRLQLIYAGGIREGDKELWMACLKGPSKAGARSVAGSEDSSLLSLFTKATGSGHLPIGGRDISVKAHPSYTPNDSGSVDKVLELIAGLLPEQRSEDPTFNSLSTAGTSAPS
jgi:hypothetical protein